jgi:light-harvesting protein B-800-850 alpha chain
MNNGRLWCVVKPTVGLPLFIGGVAVTSLTVHMAILNNTTWFADFMRGSQKAARAQIDTSKVAPVVYRSEDGKSSFAINVTASPDNPSSFVIKVDRLPGDLALATTK